MNTEAVGRVVIVTTCMRQNTFIVVLASDINVAGSMGMRAIGTLITGLDNGPHLTYIDQAPMTHLIPRGIILGITLGGVIKLILMLFNLFGNTNVVRVDSGMLLSLITGPPFSNSLKFLEG